MNSIEAEQSFDASFDAFLQAPSSSSPVTHLPAGIHSPSTSLAHVRLPDGSLGAFGIDSSDPSRPSSSGGNLHLNISNLSVNGAEHDMYNGEPALESSQQQQQHRPAQESQPQQPHSQSQPQQQRLQQPSQQQQQQSQQQHAASLQRFHQLPNYSSQGFAQPQSNLQNDFMLGGPPASSPHSMAASPHSDAHALGVSSPPSINAHDHATGSPMSKNAFGTGHLMLGGEGGEGEASGNAKQEPGAPFHGTPTARSNAMGSIQTAVGRSFSDHSIKSAAGPHSAAADSPVSGFGPAATGHLQGLVPSASDGLAAEGVLSLDDSSLAGQSEADLAAEKRQSSKFVYKLFRMVSDQDYQHLISWNRNGTSVMVCNFDEFAKEVLGKHFKHSNFSSFIRQLNMYGFYKVNKTPRGHRQSVDTQIWEFSHPKFLRGRPDLLDDIRRKALDSEHARVEARDLQYSVSVGQMQLRQQVEEMSYRLDDLTEQNMALRSFTTQLRDVLGVVLEHIKKTNGGHVPFDVRIPTLDMPSPMPPSGMWTPQLHDGPPIFVTEPEYGGQPPRHPGSGSTSPMFPGPGQDPFSAANHAASRRVSHSSVHGEAMMPLGPDFRSGSFAEQGGGMVPPGMLPAMPPRSSSFDMLPPQYGDPRNHINKPTLAGLAIDTSAAAGPLFAQSVSPTSTGGGLTASNAGFGHLSMPPSPLTPQHQAMFAAINTPLPPSPAPHAANGGHFSPFDASSPYMQNNGFQYAAPLSANAAGFFGANGSGESEGPNAKAMRTPLKRTASNSGPSQQGTPVLVQHAGMQGPLVSPGLMKRKSPV